MWECSHPPLAWFGLDFTQMMKITCCTGLICCDACLTKTKQKQKKKLKSCRPLAKRKILNPDTPRSHNGLNLAFLKSLLAWVTMSETGVKLIGAELGRRHKKIYDHLALSAQWRRISPDVNRTNRTKRMVERFVKCACWLSCPELDERADATLVFVRLVWS